jgi:hypothetical protein
MAKQTLTPDGLPKPRGSYSLVNIASPAGWFSLRGRPHPIRRVM